MSAGVLSFQEIVVPAAGAVLTSGTVAHVLCSGLSPASLCRVPWCDAPALGGITHSQHVIFDDLQPASFLVTKSALAGLRRFLGLFQGEARPFPHPAKPGKGKTLPAAYLKLIEKGGSLHNALFSCGTKRKKKNPVEVFNAQTPTSGSGSP